MSREHYITGKAAINFQPLEALRVDGISCLTLIEMNRPSYRPQTPGCCSTLYVVLRNIFPSVWVAGWIALIFTFGLRFLAIYRHLQMPAIFSTKQG